MRLNVFVKFSQRCTQLFTYLFAQSYVYYSRLAQTCSSSAPGPKSDSMCEDTCSWKSTCTPGEYPVNFVVYVATVELQSDVEYMHTSESMGHVTHKGDSPHSPLPKTTKWTITRIDQRVVAEARLGICTCMTKHKKKSHKKQEYICDA